MRLDSHEVERRLRVLVGEACRGDERDIGWIAAFALSVGNPLDYALAIEESIVYLARYMRQSIEFIEAQDATRVRGWIEIVSSIIRKENGVKEPDAERLETEYT